MQRSGFDSRRYQIFWEVVGLERGPLSLVSTTEELLERKSSGSGPEIRDYGRRGSDALTTRTPLYQQKLALTSTPSGGLPVGIVRSRNQSTKFVCPKSTKNVDKRLSWGLSNETSAATAHYPQQNHSFYSLSTSCVTLQFYKQNKTSINIYRNLRTQQMSVLVLLCTSYTNCFGPYWWPSSGGLDYKKFEGSYRICQRIRSNFLYYKPPEDGHQ
jgi:hypothetical protein